MQYELYIDVFFLVNFMMDFLLLTFLKRMMRLDVPGFRVVLGALAGAAITCDQSACASTLSASAPASRFLP